MNLKKPPIKLKMFLFWITVLETDEVVGSATLHRKKNRVIVNIHTTGLTPGNAYTIWWVVFNPGHPGPGLAPPSDVIFATGHVVSNGKKFNFSASLNEDDNTGSVFPPGSPGLTDAAGAEIHVAVRSHGQVIPELVDLQISTIDGGCNPCQDQQAAIFFPIP